MNSTVELACRLDCSLCEGPFWSADEQALHFVDIKGGSIHRYDARSGDCASADTGGEPSFIVPEAGGQWLVGRRHEIRRFDGQRLTDRVISIPQPAHNRTNDATVDHHGRLWFGTMDNEERAEAGALWCLDRGRLRSTPVRAIVTNGPALSGDARSLYHVDSVRRQVWRFSVSESGELDSGRVVIKLQEADGLPDGIVTDSEDCLWIGLWDGWGVRRYTPDGHFLAHVPLPCARVTKLAFGGPDFRTAYVTTANFGLDAAARAAQPLAGSLFRFQVSVPGRVSGVVPRQ